GSVVDERFARAGNGQNSFHKGPPNILGTLVRQRRWRQADAARTHLRLVPKRAHPRIGSRLRGIAGAPRPTARLFVALTDQLALSGGVTGFLSRRRLVI